MADESKPIHRPPVSRRFISAVSKWGPIAWLISLNQIEQLRLWGVIFSCMATSLVVIAVSTEYWVKRFVRGLFVYRGLWKDCKLGQCTYFETVPYYIGFSIFCMLASLAAAFVSVITGTLSLTPHPPPKHATWPYLTIFLCAVSGISGGSGLFHFMRLSTKEPNTFLSWSLAPGWLSVIAISMAGVCHFIAKRWEKERIIASHPTCTTLLTLQEDPAYMDIPTELLKKQKPVSTTAV